MAAAPKGRLRADGQRNRDQILTSARETFAARGADIPMEEMARAAGVGVGTLYRHFPDRDALILAVAQDSLVQVVEDARTASAEEPTGWNALARLLGQSHQLQVSLQLAWNSERARRALSTDPECDRLKDALLHEISQLVHRAQAEGTMRLDVGAGDVASLMALVLRQPPAIAGPRMLAAAGPRLLGLERATAIVLDGLRVQSGSELPGQPVTVEDVELWRAQFVDARNNQNNPNNQP